MLPETGRLAGFCIDNDRANRHFARRRMFRAPKCDDSNGRKNIREQKIRRAAQRDALGQVFTSVNREQ